MYMNMIITTLKWIILFVGRSNFIRNREFKNFLDIFRYE